MFRGSSFLAAGSVVLAAATAFTAGGIARADVIEIGNDGSVHRRDGAKEVRWTDPTAVDAAAADGDTAVEPAPASPDAALTVVGRTDAPAAYSANLDDLARRYDLSPRLIAALVWQESRWRADAVSVKGARGLTQLMPGTARAMGVDAADPRANLEGGARFLRQMLDAFDGDVERALAAYNAGPNRVLKAGGVPAIPETRAYVASIVNRLSSDTPKGN